jgi:hypothetical protein
MGDLELIKRLEQKLKGARPGFAAQLAMAPHPRPGQKAYRDVEDSCLKAGVMVLLYPRGDAFYLALIHRTSSVLHHVDEFIEKPKKALSARASTGLCLYFHPKPWVLVHRLCHGSGRHSLECNGIPLAGGKV